METFAVLAVGLPLICLAVWITFQRPELGLWAFIAGSGFLLSPELPVVREKLALCDFVLLLTWACLLVRHLLARRVSRVGFQPMQRRAVLFGFAFIACCLVSFSVSGIQSKNAITKPVVETANYLYGLLMGLSVVLLCDSWKRWLRAFQAWAVGTGLVVGVGLWSIFGSAPAWTRDDVTGRLSSTLRTSNQLPGFCLPMLGVLIAWTVSSRRPLLVRLGLLSLAGGIGVVVLETGSRTGLVMLTFCLLGIIPLALMHRARDSAQRFVPIAVSALFLGGLGAFAFSVVEDLDQGYQQPINYRPVAKFAEWYRGQEPLSESRSQQLELVWRWFPSKPWLGYGPGNVTVRFRRGEVHNTYANVLLEEGLVGLAVLLGMLGVAGWCLLASWQRERDPDRKLMLGAVLLGYVTLLIYGLAIFGLRQRTLWILWGLAVAAPRCVFERPTNTPPGLVSDRANPRSRRFPMRPVVLLVLFSLPIGLPACRSWNVLDFGSATPRAENAASSGGFGAERLRPPEARPTSWKASSLVPHSARLLVGDDDPLRALGLQAEVRVDGSRARVLLSYLYANDRSQNLEGTFELRLPEGAAPSFLAFGNALVDLEDRRWLDETLDEELPVNPEGVLDALPSSWSQVKAARLVPRETATQAYHRTVQRRVDPALAEWAGAGVFRCRVFPMFAGQVQRVLIGYDVDLVALGDDWQYRFAVPEGLPACRVRLDVARLAWGDEQGPVTLELEAEPQARAVDAERARFVFDEPAPGTLGVRIGRPGTCALVSPLDQDPYFMVELAPTLPPSVPRPCAERAVFLFDSSLGSTPETWRALLAAILTENADGLRAFAVLFSDVEQRWWRPGWTENTPQARADLAAAIDGLVLEGASDLAAGLREARAPAWAEGAPADLFLLHDGAATWGEVGEASLRRAVDGAGAVYAYDTGLPGSAPATLRGLTGAGGCFALTGPEQVADAARAHRQEPWAIAGVALEGTADLLLEGQPSVLFPGQRLKLVGRGRPLRGPVRLRLRQADAEVELALPLERLLPSPLAARAYGQVAVERLAPLAGAPVATAYARHFRVPGPSVALLMLESEADYQAFGIVPEDDAAQVAAQPASTCALPAPEDLWTRWEAALRELGAEPRALVPRRPLAVAPAGSDFQQVLAAAGLDRAAVRAEAERRRGEGAAVKVLSSLLERSPGDLPLLRELGFRLEAGGFPGHAFGLYAQVAAARPYEPLSFLRLARCAEDAGCDELAVVLYEHLLAEPWDARYGPFAEAAREEYAGLLAGMVRGPLAPFAAERRSRLGPLEPRDFEVALLWNTDASDVDLHVVEPDGDECYYEQQTTGEGALSGDVTTGLGLERYACPERERGTYLVSASYYASDRNRTAQRSCALVAVVEDRGRPSERRSLYVLELDGARARGSLSVGGP